MRLTEPGFHREAITSRPLFLSAIATRTLHPRQTTIRVTSTHAKAKPVAKALAAVAALAGILQKVAVARKRLLRSWTIAAVEATDPELGS